ncbi:MAG: hypothetical protein IKQ06_01430 [Bacilli bacterium]|nr:hypothetical protein [Bacilli bacterium]
MKDDVHSISDDVSVLEQVVMERDAELRAFDNMIKDEQSFNLALVTMPDEYLVRLYDYLVKQESKYSFMVETDEEIALLNQLNRRIVKLEEFAVIQEHMTSHLSPEEKAEIEETAAMVEERQKVRKMGPVRKLVYNFNKNRRK